jgi:hypothetical protein
MQVNISTINYISNSKKNLGQFFTTNSDYILQGFESLVKDRNIIDPFCGAGDLLSWASVNRAKSIIGYDIDSSYINNTTSFLNNSIQKPKDYSKKDDFILTNPPYLYTNYNDNKSILQNTKHTDLYHLSLESLLNSNEGIVIVPINFLSSSNAKYIREIFFAKFKIVKANFFTKAVFADTTISVIAFYYIKKSIVDNNNFSFKLSIFPENININITLEKKYNWQIGGDFLSLINNQKNTLNAKRLLEEDMLKNFGNVKVKCAYNHLKDIKEYAISSKFKGTLNSNIIILKAIDSGTNEGKISLIDRRNYNIDALVSKHTSRNQIQIMLENVSVLEQEFIIKEFNAILNTMREKYFSLFITNFRDNNRKRISFDFVYNLINFIYYKNFVNSKDLLKD